MSKIDKKELFEHLRGFLKNKGVELQPGSYTRRLEQGCHLLAETVNSSQEALQRAKVAVNKNLDRVRQVIHEKTAPKAAPVPPPAPPPPTTASEPTPKPGPKKPKSTKGTRARAKKSI
jgi:hypothetical protein